MSGIVGCDNPKTKEDRHGNAITVTRIRYILKDKYSQADKEAKQKMDEQAQIKPNKISGLVR